MLTDQEKTQLLADVHRMAKDGAIRTWIVCIMFALFVVGSVIGVAVVASHSTPSSTVCVSQGGTLPGC